MRPEIGLFRLTGPPRHRHTGIVLLQMDFKTGLDTTAVAEPAGPVTLVDLREGHAAIVERLDMPVDVARRLMELGFLPGSSVVAARCAPGGDPRVFRVDGSEVALRNETAAHIFLQRSGHS